MSIRALEYAVECITKDTRIGSVPRLVFMCLGNRCNGRTCTTYSGEWLERETNRSRSTVSRAIAELVDAGYLAAEHRPGRSTVVRFPLTPYISTGVAPAQQVGEVEPLHQRNTPLHQRNTPAHLSARVPVITGSYTPPPAHPHDCVCDGTGWEHVADDERGYVRPCPGIAI